MMQSAISSLQARTGLYRRLAVIALLGGLICGAWAAVWWLPPQTSNTAFSRIAVPLGMADLWAKHVSEVHEAALPFAFLPPLFGFALFAIIAVLFFMRRHRWLPASLVLLGLVTQVGGNADRRLGVHYAEPAAISAATLARMTALGRDAALEKQLVATGGVSPHELTRSGIVIKPIDVPNSHNIVFRQSFDPFDPTNNETPGFVTRFGDRGTPAAVFTHLHFCLAQVAYLKGDAAGVRDQLNRIDHRRTLDHGLEGITVMDWRISIMREWLAAKGMPVDKASYFPLIGLDILTTQVSRVLGWTGLVASILLLLMAGVLGGLAALMSRRTIRIDELIAERAALTVRLPRTG